ncbi:phosphatidylserine decarboxylase [Pseudomonas oryzihabitans]|uniref:phosphatidylserine decarboxylase n=1 Tax=Pseudomonas oryzihabitans TaxID=47885 RepID=UPI00285B5721|nr:phosphatidylserine decarboxylase [Pseudomonas psychrotolerans]MDR6678124.1 phosphatidylserine decarboxylase precursor [Pseudomonas psychrotolerans]
MEMLKGNKAMINTVETRFDIAGSIDSALKQDIELSLAAAKKLGQQKLDKALYQALIMPRRLLSDWPTTYDQYLAFVGAFYNWRPIEEAGSQWSNHYSGKAAGSQEIYDRLCFFYFLINQPLETPLTVQPGQTLQQNPNFNKWVNEFSIKWGEHLSQSDSFGGDSEIKAFIDNAPLYSVIDSLVNPANTTPPFYPVGGEWTSFNAFFARQLRSGLRPIATPASDKEVLVTRPADCTFRAAYQIDSQGRVVTPDGQPIVIKGTHTVVKISELLQTSDTTKDYNALFANGTFIHYFLAPYSYHRFHAPVSGTIIDQQVVTGIAYLAVNVTDQGQFDAPDSSEDGYEFQQARGFVVIDTSQNGGPDIGLVATAPIGMCQVSGVVLKDASDQPLVKGTPITQGDQFGYFQFGGSDIIVLLQQPSALKGTATLNMNTNSPTDFNPDTQPHYSPDYYSYGTKIVSITKN